MGDRVGWRKESSWLSYSNLNLSQTEPSGHLPCVLSVGRGWRRWQFFEVFSSFFVLGVFVVGGFSAFAHLGWGGSGLVVFLFLGLAVYGRGGGVISFFALLGYLWWGGWVGFGGVVGFVGALLVVGFCVMLPSSCATVAQTLLLRHAECNT